MNCLWWFALLALQGEFSLALPISVAPSVPPSPAYVVPSGNYSSLAPSASPSSNNCSENEQYTQCSSSSCFEEVCGVPPTELCTKDCVSGCQCKRGFARAGQRCVPVAECPDNSTRRNGDTPQSMGVLRLQSVAGRCVASPAKAGDRLVMHDCSKTSDLQLDARVQGTVRSLSNPSMCLATNSSQGVQGVELAPCADSPLQRFQYNKDDGTLRLVAAISLCLHNTPVSAVLSLVPCSGIADQQWQLEDNGCIPAQTAPISDYGIADEFRGWYDTQGCGTCRDYCRWVGSESGGDPSLEQLVNTSHWSCALAGGPGEFTLPNHFDSWNLTKCSPLLSDEEVRRSAAAAPVLEAEMPTVPRSVPRRIPPIHPTKGPPSLAPSSALTGPVSNASNASGTEAIATPSTRMASMSQAPRTEPTSPNAYAIPLGVIGGLLVLVALFIWFRSHRRKHAKVPMAASMPQNTVVVPVVPPPVPPRTRKPSAEVLPPAGAAMASDDPPPPYHAIEGNPMKAEQL